jgi:hypothetical protein
LRTWRQWWRVAARALIPAVIAGVATAVTSTGRISWSLALSGALCWSILAVLQAATAVSVVAPSLRGAPSSRGLELFFLGHAAWSMWLILGAAAVFGGAPSSVVIVTALVPLVWTAVVVYAFFRQVAGLDAGLAFWRTAIHQALTGALILLYFAWAVQLWPRILSLRGS